MSPKPVLTKNGTPSHRALSMYSAAAKYVGVGPSKHLSTLSLQLDLYWPRMTSLGSNWRIDLKTLTWKEANYLY